MLQSVQIEGCAVPSWPPLDQSSPSLPLIFAAYEKRLLAAWPKKVHHYSKKQSFCRQRKTLAQCPLGIIDTSRPNTVTSSQVPMPAQSCNYHPTLGLAAYRLVLPPDTRTKQKAIIYHAGRRHDKNKKCRLTGVMLIWFSY